jgi:hypothetical protein
MNKLALVSALACSMSVAACVIPMSTRGAEEAQMRQYQRMCGDANYAYESGNNDGMKRRSLDTQWVDMYCVPEYRQQVRQAYQSGYQLGIQNAPIVVEGRGFGGGGGRARSYSSAQTCTFASDCGGDGYSCRPDSSGTSVCMGNGYAGDPCWFGSDCLSGSCNGAAKECK